MLPGSAQEESMIVKDLLKIKDQLTQVGITELHLFYKGPVTMAIRAITDNWYLSRYMNTRRGAID